MAEDIIPAAQAGEGAAPRGISGTPGTDYRQLERPAEGIQPYHLQHSGADQHAEELRRVFQGITEEAHHFGMELGRKQGAADAAAAGPNAKPITGLGAITARGEAYNAAVHTAYIANTKANLEGKITELEEQYRNDPAGFQTQAAALMQGTLKEAPALYKAELQADMTLRINAGGHRLREQQRIQAGQQAVGAYQTGYLDRIKSTVDTASATLNDADRAAVFNNAKLNEQSLLHGLVVAGEMNEKEAANRLQAFTKDLTGEIHKQFVIKTADSFLEPARRGNVQASDRLLQQYMTDPAHTQEDKDAVQARYEEEAGKFHTAQARAHVEDVRGVDNDLAAGQYGPNMQARAKALYTIGAYSTEQYIAATNKSIVNEQQAALNAVDLTRVDAAVHTPGTAARLDPGSKADIKAVDAYIEAHHIASNVAPLSDGWTTTISAFAHQIGLMPNMAQRRLAIGISSPNPAEVAQAVIAGERLRKENPELDPYDKDTKNTAKASMIMDLIDAGLPQVEAVQRVEARLARGEEQKKVIDANYKTALSQNTGTNVRALESVFGRSVGIRSNTGLQAEYNALVRQYYDTTQDLKKAQELASQQVARTWKPSTVNGTPELMKDAPSEKDVPVIRADLAAWAKEVNYPHPASEIHLGPNPYTAGTRGGGWGMYHVDPKTGDSDVILNPQTNRPKMYSPPPPPSPKDLEAKRMKALEDAKKLRDSQRANKTEVDKYEEQLAEQAYSPSSMRKLAAGM